MATKGSSKPTSEIGERRFVIYNIGWDGYQGLLKIIGDRLPRLTYNHGDVELMKPMLFHERCRSLLGRVVSTVCEEFDLPMRTLGSTTLYRHDRDCGLDADASYYLANAGRMGSKDSIDLDIDPPPDLAVEVEITSWELDRLVIYARLGFPELWRFDGEVLTVYHLKHGDHYLASETSLAFPFLPMKEVEGFIRDYDFVDDISWARSFRSWILDVILPRHKNPAEPE
jgi:Uma2 family endonuclease